MKLYHATFQCYLSSIQKSGLLPNQQKNWADCESGFVYLASDKEGAISFCEVAEDTPAEVLNSGILCFEIDSVVLDPALLFIDPNILWEDDESPWCFVYASQISPDVLHLCWTEELGDIKVPLSKQIQSASNRVSEVLSTNKVSAKELSPEY